jgi:hypothetical protein
MAFDRTYTVVTSRADQYTISDLALRASPEELRTWLEWAGSKLLAMQISSPKPKGPHTSWPSFAQEAALAYGYTGERLRPALPRSQEIELMDKILLFPNLVTDITSRRIINSRSLVTPVSNRYLYSWSKLAFMLHMDRRRVIRLHFTGLCEIVSALPKEKVDAIRRLLPLLQNPS